MPEKWQRKIDSQVKGIVAKVNNSYKKIKTSLADDITENILFMKLNYNSWLRVSFSCNLTGDISQGCDLSNLETGTLIFEVVTTATAFHQKNPMDFENIGYGRHYSRFWVDIGFLLGELIFKNGFLKDYPEIVDSVTMYNYILTGVEYLESDYGYSCDENLAVKIQEYLLSYAHFGTLIDDTIELTKQGKI